MQRGLLGAALSPPFVPKRLPRLPVAEAWVNSGKLTLAAVAAAHRGVMKIKRSPDPHFMYNEVGVVDRLPDKGGVGSRTEFVEMCPSKFVRAVESQDGVSPPFHYYTCGVMQHAPGFAEEACGGWQHLIVEESASAHRHATPPHSSIWVGGRGSTTQAHYDVLHNVFVQVYGRKRFRLWGPDAHAALKVFPDAHPRARKAQVLIDSTPGVPAAEFSMTLEPGEALFIPAFWFHHVEALSPSVSVNVFSDNAMKLAAQNILMCPPPDSLMRAAADANSPHAATAGHLTSIAQQLSEHIQLDTALASTVAERYAALSPVSAAACAGAVDPSSSELSAACDELDDTDRGRVISEVLGLFGELEASIGDGASRHRKGMQEIVAAHLLEAWALRAVGALNAGQVIAQASALSRARSGTPTSGDARTACKARGVFTDPL